MARQVESIQAIRSWMKGFQAVAIADRAADRLRGPNGKWASEVSLTMIAAARQNGLRPDARDVFRDREARAVRRIWARLRRRFRTR